MKAITDKEISNTVGTIATHIHCAIDHVDNEDALEELGKALTGLLLIEMGLTLNIACETLEG